jgi:hypothetical protein
MISRRNGNAICCVMCGKPITSKRGSRRQRYCNDACKFKAFRSKKWADRYQIPDPQRSAAKDATKTTACRVHFGGRAYQIKPPQNLVGGFSWPGAIAVETALVTCILSTEIGTPRGS